MNKNYIKIVYENIIDVDAKSIFINSAKVDERKVSVDGINYYKYIDPDSNCKKLAEDINKYFFKDKAKVEKNRIVINEKNYIEIYNIILQNGLRLGIDYIGPSTTSAYHYGYNEAWKNIYKGRVLGGHIVWPLTGTSSTINTAKARSGFNNNGVSDRIDYALFEIKHYLDDKDKKNENYKSEKNKTLRTHLYRNNESNRIFFEMFNNDFKIFCDFFKLKYSFVDENYEINYLYDEDIKKIDYSKFAKKNIEFIEKRNIEIFKKGDGKQCF